MTDRVLPSEEIANSIVELMRDTLLVGDEHELGRFVGVEAPEVRTAHRPGLYLCGDPPE